MLYASHPNTVTHDDARAGLTFLFQFSRNFLNRYNKTHE